MKGKNQTLADLLELMTKRQAALEQATVKFELQNDRMEGVLAGRIPPRPAVTE